MEIWKDIKEYEGYYQISNYGRVKSLSRELKNHSGYFKHSKTFIMKLSVHPEGYLLVGLRKNNIAKSCRVHRLVAQAFISNPKNKRCVNHIDCNKQNNRVENLEWVTYSENMKHAFDNGLSKPHNTSKKVMMYDLDGNYIKKFESCTIAVNWLRDNGYPKASSGGLSDCCRGKTKTAYKHKWELIKC